MGYATSATSEDILKQANNTMSFPEFLYMCGEKKVVPHLVNKKEIEEIFRRTNFPSGDRDKEEIQVGVNAARTTIFSVRKCSFHCYETHKSQCTPRTCAYIEKTP